MDEESFLRRYCWSAAFVLVGVCIVAFIANVLLSGGDTKKRVLETVAIRVIPPAPPPPPPPKTEPPPEPPKIVEHMERQEKVPDKPKEATKSQPPPALGLDAKGSGPGDGFGLAGRPGGEGLIGGGSAGGGGRFGAYASTIQTQIEQRLRKNDKLAHAQYRLAYKLWISESGKPERVELLSSSGNPAIDALIKETLTSMPSFQAPPKDMPQPVILGTSALRQG